VRGRRDDGKPREDGFAVAAALVGHRLAESAVHLAELAEKRRLIDARGSLGAVVDLLQGDEVRRQIVDDLCQTLVVELLVHRFAVMDVVGQHAKRSRTLGLDRSRLAAAQRRE